MSQFYLREAMPKRFLYCILIKLIRLVFLKKKLNKEQPFRFAVDYRISFNKHFASIKHLPLKNATPLTHTYQNECHPLLSPAPKNTAFIKKPEHILTLTKLKYILKKYTNCEKIKISSSSGSYW